MQKVNYAKGIGAGIISGTMLDLFLKIIQLATGSKVYTLLQNIDYVPVIKSLRLNEFAEFGLHLFISILLSITIQLYLQRKVWSSHTKVLFTVNLSISVGLFLFQPHCCPPEHLNLLAYLPFCIGSLAMLCMVGCLDCCCGEKVSMNDDKRKNAQIGYARSL